jgi:hypothetical protein
VSFARRDHRLGKDVFTLDGVYLGIVLWINGGRRRRSGTRGPKPGDPRSAPVGQSERAGAFSGEALGPMPTAALGNFGPRSQSADSGRTTTYSHESESAIEPPATLIVVRTLTSLNWSTLRPRVRRIRSSTIQAESLERIVLSVTASELDGRH